MVHIYTDSTAKVGISEDRKTFFHNKGESQCVNFSLAQTCLWIFLAWMKQISCCKWNSKCSLKHFIQHGKALRKIKLFQLCWFIHCIASSVLYFNHWSKKTEIYCHFAKKNYFSSKKHLNTVIKKSLSTENTVSWLYTLVSHLISPSFCSAAEQNIKLIADLTGSGDSIAFPIYFLNTKQFKSRQLLPTLKQNSSS